MKLTRHHCIPRSIGGCNCKANIVRIPEKEHREYHKRWSNIHPYEVIKQLEEENERLRKNLQTSPPKDA